MKIKIKIKTVGSKTPAASGVPAPCPAVRHGIPRTQARYLAYGPVQPKVDMNLESTRTKSCQRLYATRGKAAFSASAHSILFILKTMPVYTDILRSV